MLNAQQGNNKHNKKANYRLGEKYSQHSNWQELTFENISSGNSAIKKQMTQLKKQDKWPNDL